MIIRLTLDDNDYTHLIECFSKDLFDKLYFEDWELNKEYTTEELGTMLARQKEMQRILNANITENPTTEDKVLVSAQTYLKWYDFIDSIIEFDEKKKEYLKENFLVIIQDNFKEEWENGEAVYYFTNSRTIITQ